MRVIGGEFRSRRLKTIPGLATRPTPDRLRETLFDVLAPRIEGVVFVDAYAGTGWGSRRSAAARFDLGEAHGCFVACTWRRRGQRNER